MATNFPTSVDTFTNPVSNDSLNSPSHSTQHANANDAIEAIENAIIDPANYPDQLVNKTTATVRPLPFAIATGAGSVTGNATFTYPVGRFTQSPILSLTILSASGASGTSATYGSSSSTGFTAYVWSGSTASTTARTVVYTAVQMTSANSSG
jgi:hypothetical protein